MPAPAVDVAKVSVGTALLWLAPANTALPAETVNYGDDWLTPWTYIGATDQGVSISKTTNTQDINIEEQSIPALVEVTSSDFQITFSLAEDTLANMMTAYGGGSLATTAAGTTQIGKTTFTLSDTLTQLAVGWDVLNPLGFFRRFYVPRVLSVGTVQTDFRRAAAPRLYPTTLRAVCPISSIIVVEKTANHT